MKPAEALAAVAAKRGLPQQSYEASPVPQGSIHEGLWYVSERDAVSREEAESEVATFPLTLYRDRDEWMTHEELFDSVSSEAATIPAEEAGWRDGEFDANDYIIEACQVGLYEALDVRPAIVTECTDGTHRWTKDQLREHAFTSAAVADDGFGDWLSRSLKAGELKTVAFLQYIAEGYGDEDEDGEPSGVVMERRISEPESACENRLDKPSSTESCIMDEARIIGPFSPREGSNTRILKLVQGDQILGELFYYDSTGTVVHVRSSSDSVRERLVQEAKARGLLHGKDIPDHLQHDQEHR